MDSSQVKESRQHTRKVLSETETEVVTEIPQQAYKGEKIGNTVRKDHKFDPTQSRIAGRPI